MNYNVCIVKMENYNTGQKTTIKASRRFLCGYTSFYPCYATDM